MKIPVKIYEEVLFDEYANRGRFWHAKYLERVGANHIELVDGVVYAVTTV